MFSIKRHWLISIPRTGVLFQNWFPDREINLVVILSFLLAGVFFAICIPFFCRYHMIGYEAGAGKNIDSWIDDHLISKLMKIFDKFDLEKRMGSKKGQKLLETVDKNERKKALFALICLFTTRILGYSIILAFDRVCKSIKRMIAKKVEISRNLKNATIRIINESIRDISRMKNLLWNILSI